MDKHSNKPVCCYCGCSWHELKPYRHGFWCGGCLNELWEHGLLGEASALLLGLIDGEDVAKRRQDQEDQKKEREEKNVKSL